MTKENMKKLYEHFINTGQTKRAEEITAITKKGYDNFDPKIKAAKEKAKKEAEEAEAKAKTEK